MNATDAPGLLVLHGPSPLLGGGANFHCFVMHMLVQDALGKQHITKDTVERIFEQSLETSWSVLALLAQRNLVWAYPETHWRPLLDATLRNWTAFDHEGARYSNGSTTGERLWGLHTNIKFVLSNMGVPTDVLNQPLPHGGPAALLRYIDPSP